MRNALVGVALLLASSPAFAQRLASRPYSEASSDNLEGIYAGIAGGGELMISDGNNGVGFSVEGRLGYSFNPALQVYLSGAFDDASYGTPLGDVTFKAEQVAVYLQYHLLVKPAAMVFARVGIGVGLSSNFVQDTAGNSYTGVGLAQAGGLGVEIRVAPGLFIAPELFYRGAELSAQGFSSSYQSIGLQVGLVYY
ncbi:MAG TPA: outer membrane beta-barrel protein [Myxococcales bacterium]|nr:outer membrane beta-barrel protein [Myxococcales bacterium]